jgi:uncharacterized protein YgbK (DUF1537 family)
LLFSKSNWVSSAIPQTHYSVEVLNKLKSGSDVLLMTDNNPDVVLQTKQIGEARQLDPLIVSKLVSALLADIIVQAINKQDLKKLVIAGGDTSATISRKWALR